MTHDLKVALIVTLFWFVVYLLRHKLSAWLHGEKVKVGKDLAGESGTKK